jgi:hypothetical protein
MLWQDVERINKYQNILLKTFVSRMAFLTTLTIRIFNHLAGISRHSVAPQLHDWLM